MRRHLVVVKKASGNYAAYCPELSGCVATGDTYEEAEAAIYEALRMHLGGLREDGAPAAEAEEELEEERAGEYESRYNQHAHGDTR